jgi:SusD family.
MGMMSCDSFLDEKSQDLYVPKTVQDYKEFLAGEGLNHGEKNEVSVSENLDILTDDVDESVNVRRKTARDSREPMWGYFTWQDDPEVDFNLTVQRDRSWEVYYHRILISNIILDKMSEMTGAQDERKDLEGETYFLRAWSYFMLVNTYAIPYENEEQASSAEAIPLNDATGVENQHLKKSSLAEVYKQIEKDLDASIAAFEEAKLKKSVYRPNLGTAYLLRSRVALYKKQYQQAADFATEAIKKSGCTLYNISDWTSSNKSRFFDVANTEIMFSYGTTSSYYQLVKYMTASNTEKGCFMVSKELLNMYDASDVRKRAFYYTYMSRTKPYKYYSGTSKLVFTYAFHLSEAYLNRAEANAELGKTAEAMDDINEIRKNRIPDAEQLSADSKESAVELIRNERRMELCFEGLRWFDLRRWGCPELKHVYSSSEVSDEKVEYVLKEGDKRYTLPIPRAERLMNN